MGVDFWGGFWCGDELVHRLEVTLLEHRATTTRAPRDEVVVLVSMLWVITLRPKPDKSDYKWSDKNWHPDYVEPRKSPRVLKKTVKK